MWPDEIPKNGTIFMEIKSRQKAWTKKVWKVWERDTWYGRLIHFCNRNAAIMWLKRYGKPGTFYVLQNEVRWTSMCVENGYVYFYNLDYGLMISAESKRTCNYAVRNN